jgi:hypothetical protein
MPAGLPLNFQFPGQIGNSDQRLGDPVVVYHNGQFLTTFYHLPAGVTAGSPLYCGTVGAEQSMLVSSGTGAALGLDGQPKVVALAQATLSATDAANATALLIELLV